MKKVLTVLAFLCLILSCSKYYDYVEGGFNGSGRSGNGSCRTYMLGIVNDLVVDNLQQIENALFISERETNSMSFDMGGKALTEEGAVWILKRENSSLSGLKITCKGKDTWLMERSGDYPILSSTYPTEYSMTVVRSKGEIESHYNWDVTLNGKRNEKEGYACSFSSDGPLKFTYVSGSTSNWSSCTGYLMMSVTKNSTLVDEACLILNGGEYDAVLRRLQ